jgi:5'(3')-deoxyribonucleotidase
MSKQVIAIDIDDVLAQGTESLRLEVNKRLGVDLQPHHYAVPGDFWGYYESVWRKNGLGGRITMEELNPQMVEDQSHVAPFESAYAVLSELSNDYKLVVVTSRDEAWRPATERWLESYFGGLFSGLYFAGRRSTSQKTKGELCNYLKAKWLIDDNVGHAQTAIDSGVTAILFGEYGWHLETDIHTDIVRCRNWSEVLEYFHGQHRIKV